MILQMFKNMFKKNYREIPIRRNNKGITLKGVKTTKLKSNAIHTKDKYMEGKYMNSRFRGHKWTDHFLSVTRKINGKRTKIV